MALSSIWLQRRFFLVAALSLAAACDPEAVNGFDEGPGGAGSGGKAAAGGKAGGSAGSLAAGGATSGAAGVAGVAGADKGGAAGSIAAGGAAGSGGAGGAGQGGSGSGGAGQAGSGQASTGQGGAGAGGAGAGGAGMGGAGMGGQAGAGGENQGGVAGASGAAAGQALSVKNGFSLAAAGASDLIGPPLYAIPIGWGYMDPMVVVDGADFYVPLFFPCDATRHVYCLTVEKNGVAPITQDTLFLGTGGGEQASLAYQPPSLFLFANTLLAVYWYLDAGGVSSLAVDGVNLNLPFAERSWVRLGTYHSPGETINYLGVAMGRDGVIYVAGYGSGAGFHALELLRAAPGYGVIEKQTLLSYPGEAYHPLYPHVAVRDDGRVEVLFTLQNGLPCPQYGYPLTAYKITAQYRGLWGQTFTGVWSDAPSDSAAAPDTNGSNCNWLNSRFPLDFLYSSEEDATYAMVRVQDIPGADPAAAVVPSGDWTQKISVWKDGALLQADLSPAFASIFPEPKDIHAVSMARLSSGVFAIFASNRATVGPFGAVVTKDFKTFSPALSIPTNHGAGHVVQVGKGYKNTASGVDRALFYHSGRLNDAWPDLPNYHLEFSGGELVIPLALARGLRRGLWRVDDAASDVCWATWAGRKAYAARNVARQAARAPPRGPRVGVRRPGAGAGRCAVSRPRGLHGPLRGGRRAGQGLENTASRQRDACCYGTDVRRSPQVRRARKAVQGRRHVLLLWLVPCRGGQRRAGVRALTSFFQAAPLVIAAGRIRVGESRQRHAWFRACLPRGCSNGRGCREGLRGVATRRGWCKMGSTNARQ